MALLELRQVSKRFGGLTALNRLDFQIQRGELVALIGPNGAGKTTLFNIISGFCHASEGRIIFKGEDISNLRPHRISKKGISRTFQETSLFMEESVLDNVVAGHHSQRKTGFWRSLLGSKVASEENESLQQKSRTLLKSILLDSFESELAKNLPHGYQRSLGIAIALATNPELLLLDEPAAGMNPEETKTLMALVRRIVDMGITVLTVEHDMKLVMGLAERIVVLNYGNKIADGSPRDVARNKSVIEAYLGSHELV